MRMVVTLWCAINLIPLAKGFRTRLIPNDEEDRSEKDYWFEDIFGDTKSVTVSVICILVSVLTLMVLYQFARLCKNLIR